MRTKHVLTADDAQKIITACKAKAKSKKCNVTIAVVDEAGYLLHLERMDGAPLHSAKVAEGKAKAAALGRVPTKMIEETIKERPAMLTFPDRLGVQGGIPLKYKEEYVGGVGVSGVKSHEDEEIALAGATWLS
jgi:glc operon protein GlcG